MAAWTADQSQKKPHSITKPQSAVRGHKSLTSIQQSGIKHSARTSSIGHSLIGVDALVQFLSIEEILEQLLDLGDTGGAANQHDVVDLPFVHLSVTQRLLHRVQGATEEVGIELFKASPGDGCVEINSLVQGVDLNAGLGAGGQGALCPLAGGAQTTHSSLVVTDVFLELALELSNEVVDHAVVEILSTQMSISSCGLHFKDTIFDGEDGHVESATAKVKDQDVSFSTNLEFQKTNFFKNVN